MRLNRREIWAAFSGALLAVVTGSAALADDTEIFFNQNNTGQAANIVLILDTSGSMDDTVTSSQPYDSTQTYSPNKCGTPFDPNSYYFGTKTPGCGSTTKIAITQFKCATMGDLTKSQSGYYTGTFGQWANSTTAKTSKKVTTTTTTYGWSNALNGTNTTGLVECKDDANIDGDGVDKVDLLPSTDTFSVIVTTDSKGIVTSTIGSVSGNQLTGVWTADPKKNFWTANSGGAYTLYSGNYLNYFYDSTQTTTQSKIHIMQQAASGLLGSVGGVNVGLMRYNFGGSGGMVLYPVTQINATNPLTGVPAKTEMSNLINSWAPEGITPLSETLYESYLYYSGGNVYFGKSSTSTQCTLWSSPTFQCSTAKSFSAPSVDAARTSAGSPQYKSPANYQCQKNYVVYLTDGLPNEADLADPLIKKLPNFATLGGSCDATAFPGANGGLCTAALARYMNNADLRPTPDVPGKENVTSYFIGFGGDFASGGAPTAAFNYLTAAATAGGGKAYSATSLTELTSVFNQIFSEVLKTNTTFTAPAVAVNAFNRTQTLNDLYVSVFSPKTTFHWPGNVKKYKVVGGQVTDQTGALAVDASTGFFKDTAQSFWSAAVDGSDVTLGGAASNIPDPPSRKVYTFKGSNPSGPTALTPFNATNVTTADLNIGGATDPDIADLVNWAVGLDVQDENNNGLMTDTRHDMGDPIHTQPTVVIYGKKADGITDDTVVFLPTNDGYFHAIDAATGIELWSYIPQEMLSSLKDLYNDDPATKKHYGLDGPISVLKYDINGDGTIDAAAGDRVILYFGTGRNASTSNYYALDVTDKNNPKFMWSVDASILPGLGQAWAAPTIARINIAGASQNSQKLTLVISGGYDASEDNYTYNKSDAVGTHLYFVDALAGTLLWSAGPTSSNGANFVASRMDHAIPSAVTVLDTDADGYVDRMYVGDMAAQLWRFDIYNGQSVANLVTGGVIASLGAKDDVSVETGKSPALSIARRFYNAPDVAAVEKPGMQTFLNIAIGSGYRGHPLDTNTNDIFYSIRDMKPFAKMSQSDYTNQTLIVDNAANTNITPVLRPVDITGTVTPTIPSDAVGWQLSMQQGSGEKVLSPSRTFNDEIIFTSYSPPTGISNTNPCAGVGTGTNRAYVVSVFNAAPILDPNKNNTADVSDRSSDLSQGGIAPEAAFLFPGGTGNGNGNNGNGTPGSGQVVCLSGVEVLNACSNFNQRVKTYWREGGAN